MIYKIYLYEAMFGFVIVYIKEGTEIGNNIIISAIGS
jgi:hypothetical protein